MGWSKLEIKVPDLKLPSLVDLIEQLQKLLQTLVSILDAILSAVTAFLDPIVALIKSIIEQLKALIESFLKDLGAYSLFVPVRKRLMTNFLGLGDITPSWSDSLGVFQEGVSPIDARDPALNEFIVNSNRYNGGNGGFFRTVLESLRDKGDLNRPDFYDLNDWVGGVVMVMGTAFDPLAFLDDIWALMKLFGGPESVPTAPKPQNLRARAMTNISAGTFDALLSWDPMQLPFTYLTDLGNVLLYPDRYAVIRGKNNCGLLGANNIVDVMGTRSLAQGDTFANGTVEVIYEDEFNFTSVSYLDTKIPTAKDDTFYYVVAWKLKAYNQGEKVTEDGGTAMDYWQISNVARVVPYPTLPASTPPDWLRTPSIESLFPTFAELVRRLMAEIEKYASRLIAGADVLKDYVEFLKREVDRYAKLINDILDELQKLQAAFVFPKTGVYMRTFKGKGGMHYFISDLARSLLPGYPNSPPFHNGDEYVVGIILLAGGLELGVDTFIEALSLFFGSEESASSELLSQLGSAVSSLEEQIFGPDMQPTDTATPVQEFNPALCPVNCKPPEETQQVFNSKMEVVNPDATT